jgi:hypothetical protein
MKPPVKSLVLLTIFFLSATISNAQLTIHPKGSIASDVKKVIDDYPNHFTNILGELILENPQSTDYQCNFIVAGAEECTITRYSSKKPVFSWQALMLTTDDFNKAKAKFRSLYADLNNLSSGTMHLKGSYEAPAEEKKFTSVLFSFDHAGESLEKLKIELTIEAEGMDWKVKVLVYDRDRDDDEKSVVDGN